MDFSEENPGGIARTLLNPKPATPLGLYFCEKEFLLAFDWGEGLCLGQVIRAQEGPLSKPSLQALPSSLVPLGKPVTIRCQGPPGADLYRLEKLKSGRYFDQAEIFISAMERDQAGRYRCSYQIGMLWSPPSSQLELVATGTSPKPSLSAQPSTAVPTGVTVTLRCQSQYGFDQFALYKEGDTRPFKTPERWYRADFPIVTVTAAHSGIYRCYSFSSAHPYLWSAPSDPLELVVTGTSVTPSWLPTEPPSTVTEASRKLNHLILNEASTTEAARNITVFPKESDPPTGDSSRSCPPVLHQGQSGPDMPWGCGSDSPGGASGRRLAQPKETSDEAPAQSCTQAAPARPADPETTGASGWGSTRWSQPWLPSLESQAWLRLRDWSCEWGGDLE
ncbi:platelet glycoprotein VI isoform X2 [Moschus berezovskii]|uniref:platelet glycoprotein VI isoform X2 n=1 Tax=Moschus berezovskii TaxID=68408 RepID=UPI002444A47D|nr:platelet glycoprotein VI isoform X2 [Moschus berezovskii]